MGTRNHTESYLHIAANLPLDWPEATFPSPRPLERRRHVGAVGAVPVLGFELEAFFRLGRSAFRFVGGFENESTSIETLPVATSREPQGDPMKPHEVASSPCIRADLLCVRTLKLPVNPSLAPIYRYTP